MTAPAASNHLATFYLRGANLELTRNCNLRCSYCGVSQPGYRGMDLGGREIERALAGLREMRTWSIVLNGHGETSTIAGWHKTIARIADWGALVHLTSNCARPFSDPELESMLTLSSLGISFDTDDAGLLRVTRRSVRLEDILGNIRRLRAKAVAQGVPGPKLVASCVVHTENVMHLDRYVRFCLGQGIHGFQFCNLLEYVGAEAEVALAHVATLPRKALVVARSKIVEAQEAALAKGATCSIQSGLLDAIDEALRGAESPPGAQIGSQRRYSKKPEVGQTRNCFDPWLFVLIQADGSVRPCCYHPEIGSLKRQPLRAILNSDAAIALRRQLMTGELSESCRTCPGRQVVDLREFNARVAARIPPSSAAGMATRAALTAAQFVLKSRVAAIQRWLISEGARARPRWASRSGWSSH